MIGYFTLYQGPFDGASAALPKGLDEAPEKLWVAPDVRSKGAFGLGAWCREEPGTVLYVLFAVRDSQYLYLHGDSEITGALLGDALVGNEAEAA